MFLWLAFSTDDGSEIKYDKDHKHILILFSKSHSTKTHDLMVESK